MNILDLGLTRFDCNIIVEVMLKLTDEFQKLIFQREK